MLFLSTLVLSLPLAAPLNAQPACRVKDINPGAPSSSPASFAVVGTTLFFAANDGTNGVALWKSDGTSAGTVMVQDIWPGAQSSSPGNVEVGGSLLYFAANDGTTGNELWGLNINNDRTVDFYGDRKTDLTVFNPPSGGTTTATGFGGMGFNPVN